jgi:hypothetical protein
VDAFKNNDHKNLSFHVGNAKTSLDVIRPGMDLIARSAAALGIETIAEGFNTASNSINIFTVAANDFDQIQKLKTGIDRESLDQLIADSIYLYFSAQRITSNSQANPLNMILGDDLSKLISIGQVVPQILGYDSERNYLLLFQNNGELRPTGGFIGSIGEVKIKGGKIEEFKINDVYDYDGKLKAHVEPHYIVRRYIQPHLYLRDSNFDPDFQNSASAAALLYNLETGKKPDGIIAVNFEVVRRIIQEIGPIKLAQYNKTIDKDNAFDFLQSTIDDNFFPGSTQKRDVLQSLFNQLTLKIENDEESLIKIARLIPKLMNEKHILFAFNGKSIQGIFSANRYGGEMTDLRTRDDNQMNDFLSVNEANIGINKANSLTNQETRYSISLKTEGIKSKISHIIHNRAGGAKDYKTYLRVIVPLGSKLESISIDGAVQKIIPSITDPRVYEDNRFVPPEGLEVDESVAYGKQIFGFIINVPKQTDRLIEISYDNSVNPVSSPIVKYSLLLIKQPGTLSYPFTLKLEYDERFAPKEVKNATLEENSISISRDINQDETFDVQLIKR